MRVFYFLLVLGLLAFTSVQLWMTRDNVLPAQAVDEAMGSGEAQIGGAFTLTDKNGISVDDTQFRSKVMLVFFGFTRCPDICPVTIGALSRMMELLGEKADRVVPVFITVDPTRDTPEVLKTFLENFDPRIVALTGSQDDITAVEKSYKAYAAKAKPKEGEAADDYVMDHSGYIYLMDKAGVYSKIFSSTTSDQELAKAVESALE